eukprot:214379_1
MREFTKKENIDIPINDNEASEEEQHELEREEGEEGTERIKEEDIICIPIHEAIEERHDREEEREVTECIDHRVTNHMIRIPIHKVLEAETHHEREQETQEQIEEETHEKVEEETQGQVEEAEEEFVTIFKMVNVHMALIVYFNIYPIHIKPKALHQLKNPRIHHPPNNLVLNSNNQAHVLRVIRAHFSMRSTISRFQKD